MSYPFRSQGSTDPVLCWRVGSLAHIRFNRPVAFNAVDLALAQGFRQACGQVASDPQVRAVILSSEGRAFMAGGDLAAMKADPVGVSSALIEEMHAAIECLLHVGAPVIAALHGMVAGGGLGVALACDLLVAAEGTRFNFAYTSIGASSDCGASWSLPRCVGLHKALEIALLCEPMDTTEALRLGLVSRVVSPECLQDEVERLGHKLSVSAPLALAHVKRLLRQSAQNDLAAQLHAEAQSFAVCAASTDFVEGMDALLEKRPPLFKGL